MDYRIPLAAQTILDFDGMACHVESVVGRGSNAIVYQGWYPDRLHPQLRHRVLIKELFPLDHQGKIRRGADHCLVVQPEAAGLWQSHRQSFLTGNAIHLRLLENHPDHVGANLNSFSHGGTLYSVLGFSGGRSMLEALSGHGQSLRSHVERMLGLLDALEAFHGSGYLHLDISPDNIMLTGTGQQEHIFLIDYNSARPVQDRRGTFASFKAGYSAPEVETGAASVGYASDLYSVAAVFFRCLMGRAMTLSERLRQTPPDGSDSPMLRDQPQTVRCLASQILRRGLHPLSRRRFQSIAQMRQAFEELRSRIDGVGVTHWALWENGKRSAEHLIRANPALQHVMQAEQLYPIRLERDEPQALPDYLAALLAPAGRSGLILAGGGMGKTTLLLRSAIALTQRYHPAAPAVFYIPLDSWNGRDPDYLYSQILMRLRFRPEENTYESAKHALVQLLSRPLRTREGTAPVVLLLLDGLNEVRGDIHPLLQQIRELDALTGVRILAASRSEFATLPLEQIRLLSLQDADIAAALGRRGMLVPRDPEVAGLLRTPLILSAFIQAGAAGLQPQVHSEEALMRAYLDALAQKELRCQPENTPERWQIEAALQYLLPCIADAEKRSGGGLRQQQLLQVVQRCWKQLQRPRLRRIFPQWIGHTADILGGAKTAEEWYGLMIHRLLWSRMGLLLRDSSGNYRIFHQTVRDHLAALYLPLKRAGRRTQAAGAGILCCIILFFAFFGWNARTEQNQNFEKAIDYASVGYTRWGWQYAQLRQLTDAALAEDRAAFEAAYDRTLESLTRDETQSATEQLHRNHITGQILPDGPRNVSWSRAPFRGELALELVGYAADRGEYYRALLPLLAGWMDSAEMQAAYPELITLFSAVLEADADLAGEVYHQACAVHLDGGDAVWQQQVRELVTTIPEQEAHRVLETMEDRPQYLENLRTRLAAAQREWIQVQTAAQYMLSD